MITARDIEAQVTRGQGAKPEQPPASQTDQPIAAVRQEEDEVLRQYMAAPERQRQEIDRLAEEKMKTMRGILAVVGPDKHQAILVQARIDAARAVLAVSSSTPGDVGEDSLPRSQ